MTSNASLLTASVLLVVLLAAYGYVTLSRYETPEAKPQIANPASEHCITLGGSLEIREDAAGAQAGYCRLPDGQICEEWALFREGSCVQS